MRVGVITAIFILILVFILVINYKGTGSVISKGGSATGNLVSRLQGFGPSGKLSSVG